MSTQAQMTGVADRALAYRVLRDAGVEAVPLEGLAVWTAKMRPMIQ